MADIRDCSRQFILDFIALYKAHPCLWKTTSKEYLDRTKKNKAYNVLAKKLQEVSANANKETVKGKINSLRASFRRETKKKEELIKSGAGADDYTPHLWYYDKLLFVKDEDIPGSGYEQKIRFPIYDKIEETADDVTDMSDCPWLDLSSQPSTSQQTHTPSTSSEASLAAKRLCSDLENPTSIFGKLIAAKLNYLSEETRIYTEKFMIDLLFEAQMGNITKETKMVLLGADQQIGTLLPQNLPKRSKPNDSNILQSPSIERLF